MTTLILVKEEIKYTRKWRAIPYLWVGRIDILKMSILPKAMHKTNAIPIKILIAFFIEGENTVLKFQQNQKKKKTPSFLKEKKDPVEITNPGLKIYHRTIVIKTIWYSKKWNKIERPKHEHSNFRTFIFNEVSRKNVIKKGKHLQQMVPQKPKVHIQKTS